jgi:YhcH/YjgK/YiaL family protein
MIIDQLENLGQYGDIKQHLQVMEILRNRPFDEMDQGRYDVEGDRLFFMLQRYDTAPVAEGKLETHENYIDVQFVVSGEEMMGYANRECLTIDSPYNPETDLAFYHQPARMTLLRLRPETFCVLYPQDAHLPGCCLEKPQSVTKVIIKIRI